MRAANVAAWCVGMLFGTLAIFAGLRWAFALAKGNGWRRQAFVIAISLATLWWPGFVDRIMGQEPPSQQQSGDEKRLGDSRAWRDMINFWDELRTLDWGQKTENELTELRERGGKLAEELRPLEKKGLLDKGIVDAILADIKERSEVMPMDVKCYKTAQFERRQVTWKSLVQQVAAIGKLVREDKIKPWTCVKLVAQACTDLEMLQGKVTAGRVLGEVPKDEPVVSEPIKTYVVQQVGLMHKTLECNGALERPSADSSQPSKEDLADMARLVARLGGDDAKDRDLAETRLLEMGRMAVPQLKEAAKSEDAEVRMRALEMLEALGE